MVANLYHKQASCNKTSETIEELFNGWKIARCYNNSKPSPLGPAPKWLPSIENLTEEMEKDAQTTIYDNFKFLTKEDLEKLNLTSLIGTNLLRASMHGFFIDYKLYKKVPKKLPKVNRKLAASVIEKEAEVEQLEADKNETKKASRKRKGLGPEIFEDERVKALFEDKDFEIDENSAEYLALHPMASMKQPSLVAEHFEPLTEDEDQSLSDSDNSAASGDEHSNENTKFKKKPSSAIYKEDGDDKDVQREKRRGIQSLGLKSGSGFRGGNRRGGRGGRGRGRRGGRR
ncbi:hypothetical protein OIU74_002608 [Salix koriyanagi]|uniref:NUC153 domain-containing protein n=1 Tax=Salix koriyanagi TaxID=2511006 RepID=A0A9Q0X7M6_9ROSI|nr:hypothetical protein OIU74_002608 [Salix koriyanagi]